MVDLPLVGILPDWTGDPPTPDLARTYSECLQYTGARGVVPQPTTSPERATAALPLAGIILSGSRNDVQPHLYGRDPEPGLGPLGPQRDQQDLAWLAFADAHRLPVLAICYGCQILAVHRGGTLIQDIATQVPTALPHKPGGDPARDAHPVDLAPDSWLRRQIDVNRVMVNSCHHQAVAVPGRDLVVSARAPDGIIEAFEGTHMDDHFVLGIQWHPELRWGKDPLSQAVFTTFVSAVRRYQDQVNCAFGRRAGRD